MLVLPQQTRISQPAIGRSIDWESKLVRALGIEAVAIHGILYTKSKAEVLTKNGSPVVAVTQTKLPSMSSNGTATNYFKTANIFKGLDNKTKLSCFAIYSCYSNTANGTVFSTWVSPFSVYCRTNGAQFELIIAQTSSNTTWASRLTASSPNAASAFNVSRIGFTWSGGSNITPYLNGKPDVGSVGYTGSPSFIQASNATLQIVGDNIWSSSPIVIIASEAWTDEQHKLINNNPWQIFQPDRRAIFLPAAAVSDQSLTQSSLFSDADTFYSQLVTPGEVALSPSLYSDADTFYAPTVSQNAATQSLTQNVTFLDTDAFYSPNVTPGSVSLAASLFTDADAFYSPTVSQVAPQTLTQSDVFQNGNIFFDHSLPTGAVGKPKIIWAKAKAKIADVPVEGKQRIIKAAKRQAKIDALYTPEILEYNNIQIKPPIVSDDDQVAYVAQMAYRRSYYAAIHQRIAEYEQDEEDTLLALML